MVILFLIFSILVNIFGIWYIYRLLKLLLNTSENIGDLKDTFEEFNEHVQGLYELNMYYGDDSIKALIEHSKIVLQRIQEFEEVYILTEPQEEPLDEEDEA